MTLLIISNIEKMIFKLEVMFFMCGESSSNYSIFLRVVAYFK